MKSLTYPFYKALIPALVAILLLTLVTPAYAASSGPSNAGTGADNAAVGTVTWGTPGNITAPGAPYATMSVAAGATTHYLQGTNYGFAIPATATITGITVAINRNGTTGGSGGIRDVRVSLLKAGVVQTTNYANVGPDWPTGFAVATYGGAADMWGNTWTPADINAANFGVVLSARNASGTTARTATVDYIQITVTYTVPTAPTITSASAAAFAVGQAGTFTVTATGVPAAMTYGVGGDPLPAGLTFNPATGVLSGTPAVGTIGTYNLIFTASNGVAPDATQNFTLTVGQAPSITSAAAATFTVGSAGSFTITTTGVPIPPTISNGSALPNGVTFVNNGDGTATLSGTPAAGTGGTYNLNLTASNGINPNATQTFVLTINQAPVITSVNTLTVFVGTAFNFTATATGFPVPVWNAVAGLPAGVTFNTGTHILSGTPASGTVGSYPITFTVTNAAGTSTQTFTLVVQKGNQTITFPNPPTPAGYGTTYTINPTSSSGLPVTVVASGACTLAGNVVTYNVLGTCTLSASQAGDASYNPAPNITRQVTVQPAATTTTITSSVNPSVLGQNVIFTVRVATAGTAIPTGTVTLTECNWATLPIIGSFCVGGTNTLGTANLVNGVATFSISTLSVPLYNGIIIPHHVVATYTPTVGSPFNGSNDDLVQTVGTANTATTLVSSINPSFFGQAVTFTATVVVLPPGAGLITGGTVSFYEAGNPTPLCTQPVNAAGVATCTISTLARGTHDITAHFLPPNSNFGTSTSAVLTQIVRRDSDTALASSLNPSVYGDTVTFTATVTDPASAGTPTGTVSFYDGAALLGTSNLNGSAVATFNTSLLSAGNHNITATYNGDNFYVASTSPTVVQVVNPKALTVTADDKSTTYGDANVAFTYTFSGFANGQTLATSDVTGTADCATTATNTSPVGSYPISCTLGSLTSNNYAFAFVDGTLTVTPKALTITADNQGKTYGFTLSFNGTEFTSVGLINADSVTSVTLTSAGAAPGAVNGSYPIIPSAAVGTGLTNYAITYVNGTLTVGGNLLVITANDYVGVNAKTYGTTLTLPGTAFTYFLAGGGSLQPGESLTSVTLTSNGTPDNAPVGTYQIVPSAAVGTGLNNYVIIYRNGQLDVNPAPLTFDPDSHTKLYGDTFTGYTGTFTGLFPFDNFITPVYDSPGAPSTATVTAPGPAYPINVTFNDPNNRLRNYTLTVDPNPAATLTVLPRTLTVTPANRSKVYGDVLTSADFTGTITGIQNGDNLTATYDSPTGDPATAAVGTYDINATLADPNGVLGNYTLVNNMGTLTVMQRGLVITSDNQSKVYGDVFSAFTGSVVGLQNGDVITPTYGSAGALAPAPVGVYNITVLPLVDTGNKLPNYTVTYNIGTLAVTRRDLVFTPDNQTKVYGDTFTLFTGTVTGLQNGDTITPNYSSPGAIATAPVAGSPYPIVITLNDPANKLGNYNYTINTGTLTVTQRPLIVTPDDKSKIYGTWFLAFTGTVNGVQNGENITANYASTGSAPTAVVGTYPITATLNDPTGKLANYAVTLNTGTLTVTGSVLTVRADNKTIFYGDPDPAFTFLYSGFMGTDTPAVIDTPPTCTVSVVPHTDIGTYPIVCSGGVDNNYTFSYVGGTLTVVKRTLTVTPADKIKLYGSVFSAFTGSISGIQFGDNITATYTSLGAPATAAVGTYDINASLVDPDGKLANYTVVYNLGTLTVNPRNLVVSPNNQTKIYGDTFSAYTATINGLQNADTVIVNYTSAGAVASATVTAPGPTYPITVTLSDPGNILANYDVTLNSALLTVTQRPLIVTPDNKAKVFGTDFTAFTGTVVGLQAGDNITETYASTGAPAAAPAGTYPITVTLNDPGNKLPNYAVTLNQGILTVGTNILTVTANNQTKIYGDPDPAFTFTYTGFQGTDTPAVLTTQPTCQVSVAHNSVGTFPITCAGGVDENYIFTYTPGTLTINPRAVVVTPDNKTKVYGDTFTAFTGTVTGLQARDNITVTYASAGAPATATVAGSPYPIVATLVDPDNRLSNYTVTLNTGQLTVTQRTLIVTPDNKNKVYGSVFNAFTGAIVGLQGGDSVVATYASLGSAATADVGTYPIAATLGDPGGILGNYAVTLNTGTLTVTVRDLVVTPADKTKIYGDVFNAFTGAIVGIQNGDPITATYASTGAPSPAPIGTYPITATLNATPAILANYNITYNTGTLTVTQRLLIVTPDDKGKAFGVNFTAFTGTVVGLRVGDNITPVYASTGAPAAAPAGTYPITVTLTDLGNLLPNYIVTLRTGILTVGANVLTVTASNQTIVYGNADPVFTFIYAGFQAGDTPAVLTTQPTCQVTVAHNAVGTYPITCSGGVDDNYVFSYTPGTLTVTARALVVTPANKTKIYGDTFTAFTGTVTGALGADSITVTYDSNGAPPAATVGPYPITATLTDPFNRLGNYTVTLNTGTLTVTPRALVVTPDDKNKVYGTVFAAFTGTIAGLQNGDNITANYASTGALATAAVGNYPITVTLSDPGNQLPNYLVTLNTGTLTVTGNVLIVTPADKVKTYGDLFTAFTGTVVGVQPGDNITATYSSTGGIANATVGTYNITVTLNDPLNRLPNYSNVILNTGTLTVNPRALVVTPDNHAKVFGTVFSAFTGTLTGVQAGDTITATYASTGAPAAAPVGSYPITAALNDPGNRLPNYTVTLNTGTLTVGLTILTVTADNQTKVYGDADPTYTFTYSGFMPGDTPAVLTTPPTCQVLPVHNAVGTFPITCSGGLDDNYTFSYVAGSLTVTPRLLTVTPDPKTKVYGDVFTAFTGLVVGLQPSDNITVTYASAGAPALATVGSYQITIALADPGNRLPNYNVILNPAANLTVTPRPLTATSDDKNKAYGVNFTAFTGSVVGIQNGDVITPSYASLGSPAAAPVGTYPITITLADPGNKLANYTVTYNTGTLTVGQYTLVVTPDNKSKVYGDIFTNFTGAVVGLQPGDNITVTYSSPGALANAATGTYPITATLNDPGGKLVNYTVTLNTGTLTVTPRALTVTPDNKAKVFGTVFTAFTGSVTGIQAADNLTVVYDSPGALAAAAVGTYNITATINDPNNRLSNYTVMLNTGTLTVGNTVLTVTAADQTIVYGAADPAFTFTYAGFINGETPAVLTTPPTCQVTVTHNAVGTFPITCSGGVDDNYIFSYVPATLTVTSRTLTVTPNNQTKVYGDTFTAFTGNTTGIQGADNITVTYASTGAPATATVGTYPITATLNDPNNRLGNYTVTLNTGTLTVTPRPLVATPDDKNKIYGTLFTAFTGTLAGIQNGDNITPVYASTGAPVAAASGTYPITVTLADPNNRLGNYTVTLNTGTLTVGGNTLVVTPADKTKTYGDAFSAFTGTIVGLQPGDIITATYTSTGAAANAAVGNYPITVTLNDPGNKLPNYTVTLNTGSLTVSPRDLVVTPADKTKAFGSVFNGFTGTVVGIQNADPITATYTSTGSPASAPVGTYDITAALVDPNNKLPNYNVTLNLGTLTVLANFQAITITIPAPASAGYNTTFVVAATATSGLPVTYSAGGTACTNVGAIFTMTSSTGVCIVQYDQPGDANYPPAAQLTQTVNAQKASQTITVTTSVPSTALNGTSFPVAATASSGLPVSILTNGNCSGNGSDSATVTMANGSGVCTTIYGQAGDANYFAAPPLTQIASVTNVPVITLDPVDEWVMPGVTATFTAAATGNPSPTVQWQVSSNGGVTFTNIPGATATTLSIPAQLPDNGLLYQAVFTNTEGSATTVAAVLHVDTSAPHVTKTNTVGDTGDARLDEMETADIGITQLLVTFNKNLSNPLGNIGNEDVTNPANYLLVRDNGDGIQTTSCKTGVLGGDIEVSVDLVSFNDRGGSGPYIANLYLNGGAALRNGTYRLIVCGTTSITDLAGNKLAGDGTHAGTDFARNFIVNVPVNTGDGGNDNGNKPGTNAKTQPAGGLLIPVTGFKHGEVTVLPKQPADKAYTATDLWLEIPKLGLKMSIMGVPKTRSGWDIAWLGRNAGWLNGSAFPTWKGNSVITAHVWDEYNKPGPFVNLLNLQYGDQVIVHAFGYAYTYQVVESALVLPNDIAAVFKHEERSILTLVTCEDYKEATQSYASRRLVRALLVSVTKEK